MKRPTKIMAAMLCDVVECPDGPAIDSGFDPTKQLKLGSFAKPAWGKRPVQESEAVDAIDFENSIFSICELSDHDADRRKP